MNIKGNIKYIAIGSLFFLVIYMFVAAIPMGNDIYFEPVWTKIISNETQSGSTVPSNPAAFGNPGIEAFILGNSFGYFTPDGTIISAKQIKERVSASNAAWAIYPQDATATPIFFPDGSPKMTIQESGFVHFDETRTYLFLPGGDGVSQYADDGTVLWKREHTAPVTAFNSSQAGTIIGYGDGQLTCMKSDGTELLSFYPGGSDYQVILGAAISEDGTLAACISGIDQQRFLLIRITGNQYKVIYHTYLEGNLRRQAFVDFEKNGNYVFYEAEKGIGIMNCQKRSSRIIPIEGQIIAAGESPGEKLFVILSKNGQNYTLSAIERPDHLISTSLFVAKNAFLIQREEAIYLGKDDQISRIDIRGIR